MTMLRYIYADDLKALPLLSKTMFRDRAHQFHTRLGWEVEVDDTGGNEHDAYDEMNPMYIVWERPDGSHGGSLRLLPTTGPTMVNDHFLASVGRGPHPKPADLGMHTVLPGTRRRKPVISAALMLGVLEVGLNNHLTHVAGVFDARMVRVYAPCGLGPDDPGHGW